MTWKQKIALELKRIFGAESAAGVLANVDGTDAEFLNAIEGLPTAVQLIESSEPFTQLQGGLTDLTGRVNAIEAASSGDDGNGGGITAEDLEAAIEAAIAPLRTQAEETGASLTAIQETVTANHTALTEEISNVKLSSAKATTHKPDAAPATADDGTGDDDGDNITMDMKDFMAGAKIHSGLNFKILN